MSLLGDRPTDPVPSMDPPNNNSARTELAAKTKLAAVTAMIVGTIFWRARKRRIRISSEPPAWQPPSQLVRPRSVWMRFKYPAHAKFKNTGPVGAAKQSVLSLEPEEWERLRAGFSSELPPIEDFLR